MTTRIQFISPYLDGDYYGTVFAALQQEAALRDMVLYVVQSLINFNEQLTFPHGIGLDAADGWLLMTNPHSPLTMDPALLRAIESSGKPVVTIGYKEDALPAAHAVLTNNRQAAREAVNHLIRQHGHRRIAYIGSREHVDLIGRYEGYPEALTDNGIPYDESLVYMAGDAMQPAGYTAGGAMLEQRSGATAVFAATDLIALGFMERIRRSGLRIPDDIAVIGFDDLPGSDVAVPPLSTVRQSFAEYASIAIERMDELIRRTSLQDNHCYVQTKHVHRESCGCTSTSTSLPAEQLKSSRELQLEFTNIMQRHYQLTGSWAASIKEERFDLQRMFGDQYAWGCLAVWSEQGRAGNARQLVVRQAFSNNGAPVPQTGTTMPVEQFPPSSWFSHIGSNEFVHMHAIRDAKKDWGFIVVIRTMDEFHHIASSDSTQTGFSIALAALERDELARQVRLFAEKLEIVSRTSNDGIWDWNVVDRTIEWSIRAHDMLGLIGEQASSSEPESFLRIVHPDDLQHVSREIEQSLTHAKPMKVEFRTAGEEEMWIYAAGDTIQDSDGQVVRVIGSLTNITEQKLAERRVRQLAYQDGLTAIANRRLFQERLLQCIDDGERQTDKKFGILLLDLDQFKGVNDSLGHHAGDELLKQTAEWLEQVANASRRENPYRDRPSQTLAARLGGDEFVLLLDGMDDEADLHAAADGIRQRFTKPFILQGKPVMSACSIGYAVYPVDGTDSDALIRRADERMYESKTHRRQSDLR